MTTKLWEADSGAVLHTLRGHLCHSSAAVAFSSDGRLLASASDDGINVWNLSSGAALQTFEGHSDSVSAVAFSLDGKLLASASSYGIVKLLCGCSWRGH